MSFLKQFRLRENMFWIFLILASAAIFVFLNTRPIYWLQNEMLLHDFFWSIDDFNVFTLHLGLNSKDFLKPFDASHVDGIFRLRQVSYFFEMVSFKFWQFFQVGFIRNYTLIILHLLNTCLLARLTYLLSSSKKVSLLSALLFLNSGVALATLIFPFRNAKILVITFFLITLIFIASANLNVRLNSFKNNFLLYALLILMLFTDETGYFLFLGVVGFVFLRERGTLVKNKNVLRIFLSVIVTFFILSHVFLSIYSWLKSGNLEGSLKFHYYLSKYAEYFSNFNFFSDSAMAFTQYFLKYNFGYWDLSFLGLAALVSSMGLIGTAFFCLYKNENLKLIWLFALLILQKAFLLPHDSGFHPIFMPQQTKFPSLLFFSYYYTYYDSLLISLIIILALLPVIQKPKYYKLIAALITIISFSNAIHLRNGPPDALAFHEWDNKLKQEMPKSLIKAQKFLEKNRQFPVYLSFPTGINELFKGRINDGDAFIYARTVPIMFLKSLVNGQTFISLKNIKSKVDYLENNELLSASVYYDIGNNFSLDMDALRKSMPKDSLISSKVGYGYTVIKNLEIRDKLNPYILFFIKGNADFIFTIGSQKYFGKQIYGKSFQFFDYQLNTASVNDVIKVEIAVSPNIKDDSCYIVGPFVINKDSYISFQKR